MTVSQRTATSGTAAVGATFSVTLPSGATTDDLILVLVANAGTLGPATPEGWTALGGWSAGSGQSLWGFYARYSASLTLSFTNTSQAGSVAAWICNAYFQAGGQMWVDGTPVAASNTTNNTILPTGAPTTSAVTDDYEVLAYAWISAATISTPASGSTIDKTQANSTQVSVALGHNNTTSLGASTATTAFSQTLSAANIRKTGVGILIRGATSTRQVGGVAATVDLIPTSPARRVGGLVVQVDYKPAATASVSATQATSASLSFIVIPVGGTTYPITRSVSQGTAASITVEPVGGAVTWPLTVTADQLMSARVVRAVSLVRATASVSQSVSLTRGAIFARLGAVTQATSLSLRKATTLTRTIGATPVLTFRQVVARTLPIQQTVTATIIKQTRVTRLVTVAQSVSSSIGRGYKRTVTATQATALSVQRLFRLTRATTGNRRVQMNVSLGRVAGRVLRATVTARVSLRRQLSVRLTVTQAQSVSLAGLPVSLQVLAAIQTRSLALGQDLTMTRAIVQEQALSLERILGFERTLTVSTQATLLRESVQTGAFALEQATAVSLDVRNVTPFYEVLLTTSVGQQVALSTAGTGRTAKFFIVRTRRADDFVAAGRSSDFVTQRRGVRFIAEERQ